MGRQWYAVPGALALVFVVATTTFLVVRAGSDGEPGIALPRPTTTTAGPNRPPTLDGPADRTRFDVVPGDQVSFTVATSDPDGDRTFVAATYTDLEGATIPEPDHISCSLDQDPGPGDRRRCTVAPDRDALAVMVVRAVDRRGGTAPVRRYLVAGSPRSYLALGDSYSAGEGVDPYFDDGADPTGQPAANRCHRSSRAFPTEVRLPGSSRAAYEETSKGSADDGGTNKHGSDRNVRRRGDRRWASWACSSATTADVTTTAQFGDRLPQLEQPDVDAGVDVVTITVGGNDVGFAEVLQACGAPPFQDHDCLDATIDGKPFVAGLRERLAALRPKLVRTYRAVLERTFGARLLVLGYPLPFPATEDEQRCTALRLVDFSPDEQDALRRLGAELNATIASAARQAGAEFVDAAGAFDGHAVCGRDGAWINGVSTTLRTWPPVDDESFHPKLTGQEALANLVNEALVSRPA